MPTPVVPSMAKLESAASERLGRYLAGSQVVAGIRNAAAATGVGFGVLASKAAIESGFQPNAQAATSSARGLFQFTEQTWLATVKEHGAEHDLGAEAEAITRAGSRLTVQDPAERSRILALRDNPEISARLAAEHLKDISEALTPVLGRKPDAAELYLGHFLGTGGATAVLRTAASDPNRAASDILPAAARANPRIFQAQDGQPLSVSQLIERVRGRVAKAYADIGLEAPTGPVAFTPETMAKSSTPTLDETVTAWGAGSPAKVTHTPERAMVSTLIEVFTRMGKASALRSAKGTTELPAQVVGALAEQEASNAASPAARKAYGAI